MIRTMIVQGLVAAALIAAAATAYAAAVTPGPLAALSDHDD